MNQEIIHAIATACGIPLTGYQQVSGGDINECFCLQTTERKYFLKLNDAGCLPDMFKNEASGLEALRNNSKLIVPATIAQGTLYNQQWLLLQWVEKGPVHKSSMKNFGAALASMHQHTQAFFGWPHNNYIGSLNQLNSKHTNWHTFYTECRVNILVKRLFDNGMFSKSDVEAAGNFCKQTANLFPQEPPSLLHGDLWAGNFMIDTNGDAAIFDPAVYYGHREMDLAMTKLFGGFDDSFYKAYHEVYPLQQGWQLRLHAGQLYPLLVHAVLFGGHYIMRVKEIIKNHQ